MKASEIFALAPFGAVIAFADGTPRPPERFTKKLAAWERNNASGVLVGWNPSGGKGEWDKDSFTMRTLETSALVVNLTHSVSSGLDYTVTAPAPGTLIAFSVFHDEIGQKECPHVWPSVDAARAWERRTGYQLGRQRWRFEIVGADGARTEWRWPETEETA